jgi:hypothetical protein
MRHVIVSLDYEVFGNGAGDVRQHVVEPTANMAALAEAHGVPLTIFFEVEEFLAFRRHTDALKREIGYDPAELIAEQLRVLAAAGHDIQLHLHPQWYGAQYANGQWELQDDKLTVDSLFEEQNDVNTYIAERKAIVEELADRGNPDHRVVAYRAGGFCAQPGQRLLAALTHNGIRVDSSVVKNLCRQEGNVSIDYRGAPRDKMLWPVGSDVAVEDPSGDVFEIPIHSIMSRRILQANFRRLRAKFSRHIPKARQKAMVKELGMGSGPLQFLSFLTQPIPIKLDCHNISPATLMRWILSAPNAHRDDCADVLVIIGHTKEHISDRSFGRLMQRLADTPSVRPVSLAEFVSEHLSPGNSHL